MTRSQLAATPFNSLSLSLLIVTGKRLTMGKKVEPLSQVGANGVVSGILALRKSVGTSKSSADKGASVRSQNLAQAAAVHLLKHKGTNKMVSEDFSDIDDAEINGYLNNQKEILFKKILWELMNEGHLKGKRQKQVTKVKKSNADKKAAKTAGKVDDKKKQSSQINYDVLEKLLDESKEDPKNVTKTHTGSNGGRNENTEPANRKSSYEAYSFGDSDSDEFDYLNEYGEEI